MKINYRRKTVSGAILMACAVMVAPGVYAGETMNNHETKPVVPAKDRVGQKAAKIIGEDVRSVTREDLGQVKDLVIDTSDGRVVYALISSGGVLGIGDKIHVVPFSAFKSGTPSDGALVLDLHGTNWSGTPTLNGNDLALYAPDRQGMDVYRQFGRDWKKDLPDTTADRAHSPGGLMRVSELKGKEVRHGTQDVGDIENIVVNFDRRHASALLDPNNDFTGTNQKFAVSFTKLSPSPSDKDTLMTSLTRSDFEKATPMREDDRTMTELYPYAWSYTAAYMPVFPLERTPIADVRSMLKEDPVVGTAVKNIQLSADEDQLILTGQVRSQELKDKIESKAEDVAEGWDVKNLLSVRMASN